MSTQDKLENVLRDIHVLISKSEVYDDSKNKIIVDKKEIFELLNRLNVCIYEVMDDYEMTKQSRDKAERDAHKKGDKIIFDASRQAEDIYAASILYTNEALLHIQDIMQSATDSFQGIFDKMKDNLKEEKQTVRENQSELKGQLQDMIDTRKYLQMIEERNKQIEKELAAEKEPGYHKPKEGSSYAAVKPEIKINTEYFEKIGRPLEMKEKDSEEENLKDKNAILPENTDTKIEPVVEQIPELEDEIKVQEFSSIEEAMGQNKDKKTEVASARTDGDKKETFASKIKVNLDSDYFKWLKNKEKKQP